MLDSTSDYVRFPWIVRGSLAELESQLMLSKELELASAEEIDGLLTDMSEIEEMLATLIRSRGKRGDTR